MLRNNCYELFRRDYRYLNNEDKQSCKTNRCMFDMWRNCNGSLLCYREFYHLEIVNTNNMKKNMGGADRIIRFIIVIAVAILGYFNLIEGTLAYVLYGVAGIFMLTSFVSFCPIYALVGLSTCKNKN